MRKFFILTLLHLVVCYTKTFAQSQKRSDTVYVVCYQDDLGGKFYVNKNSQSMIDFHFDIKWKLHEGSAEAIVFSYTHSKSSFNSIQLLTIDKIKLLNNLYTLRQFTTALGKGDFLRSIADGNIQIMMLNGERCSTKFEVLPVVVATDLSSEG